MRVVEIPRAGGPEVLRVREVPDPEPAAGQVLVDARASGVNFADVMGRLGIYPDAPKFPYVPGYEVAGVADGRRVIAVTRFNGYAEKVLARPENVVPLPENLSFEEGAALPVNYVTAWVALVRMARVAAGHRVLVEHGAGGVGIAALQIARHLGAEVYAVVGSAPKADFIASRGARPVIRGEAWPERLDVILDPTGWGGLDRDLKHLAPSGCVVLYGASELVTSKKPRRLAALLGILRRPRIDPVRLINRNRGVYGLNLMTYWRESDDYRSVIEAVLGGVRAGWLKPHVGKTFPLEQAAQAHDYLQDRKNIGKVVLTVAPQES